MKLDGFRFILDNCAIINILKRDEDFFSTEKPLVITAQVLKEFLQAPGQEKYLPTLQKYVFNNPYFSADFGATNTDKSKRRPKEKRLIMVGKDGPVIVKSKNIGTVDYSLIAYCQSESDLILVTDDDDMAKSAIIAIGSDGVISSEALFKFFKGNESSGS